MSAAPRRAGRGSGLGDREAGRSPLGRAEASVPGHPGGPASRTGRAAHGGAAGTRPLSSLQQENKQKAGRLRAGTTGRFPWEKLPCSSPRWPCGSLHRARRPGRGAAALRAAAGAGAGPEPTTSRPQLQTRPSCSSAAPPVKMERRWPCMHVLRTFHSR